MTNTPNDAVPYRARLSRELQLRRIRRVYREELTPCQQEVMKAYYMEKKTVAQIARERGVRPSTVYRTLHRAVNKMRRFLKY